MQLLIEVENNSRMEHEVNNGEFMLLKENRIGYGQVHGIGLQSIHYLAEYSIIMWPGNIYKSPSNAITALILLIILIMAYGFVIALLRAQRKESEFKHSNNLLKNYADSLKHEAELMRQSEETMKIYRHDLRHKMRTIGGYITQDRKEDAIHAIETMVEGLEILTPIHCCKNVAINGI